MGNYKELGRTGLATDCFSRAQFLFSQERVSGGRKSYRVWTTFNGKAHTIASVVDISDTGQDLLDAGSSFILYPEEPTKLNVWRYCWNPCVSGDRLLEELEWVEENYAKRMVEM